MAGSVVAQAQRGIMLRLHHSASCSHGPCGPSTNCELLGTGHTPVATTMARAAGRNRSELWLLRRNFFVGAFGAHIVADAANAGLRDDQFASSDFYRDLAVLF